MKIVPAIHGLVGNSSCDYALSQPTGVPRLRTTVQVAIQGKEQFDDGWLGCIPGQSQHVGTHGSGELSLPLSTDDRQQPDITMPLDTTKSQPPSASDTAVTFPSNPLTSTVPTRADNSTFSDKDAILSGNPKYDGKPKPISDPSAKAAASHPKFLLKSFLDTLNHVGKLKESEFEVIGWEYIPNLNFISCRRAI